MSVTFTNELTGDPVGMANCSAAVVTLFTLGHAEPYGDEDAQPFVGRVLPAPTLDP
ncbi:hypothetical protein FBY35_0053 [Streptomyces sp. SLBN-118]|uniref:hypothetical protein n=1 Tax=Streptomyces sp. SLBN-118 TaxID=2768454 RepID=UPI0011730486|nr:hypothetical protein [Streptomyces sp. SLBN-118]TQK49790.1 hypothetical protein FBY35_0053 [Streptomyces sp. SLBN-118]